MGYRLINPDYILIGQNNTGLGGTNDSKIDTWLEYKVLEQSGTTARIKVYLYASANVSGVPTSFLSKENYGYIKVKNEDPIWCSADSYDFNGTDKVNKFAEVEVSVADDGTGPSVQIYGQWTTNGHSGYVTGGYAEGSFSLPKRSYPFNLNILMPNGSETYTAGTVDVSTDGGLNWHEDQKNEPNEGNSFYPYGTAFKFKDFKPGTGLRLSYVDVSTDGGLTWSGVTQNADGTWSATQGATELVVRFHTEYETYDVTQTHYLPGGIGFQNTVDKASYDTYFTPYTVTPPAGYSTEGATFNYFDANHNHLGSGTIGQNSFSVSGTHFVEVYYTAETYTVTYDANGGVGSMEPSTATYHQEFMTRPNTYQRPGYEFIGWNEAPDGSGEAWTLDSTGVYESGKGPWWWGYDYSITLYAQWKPKAEMFAKDGDHYRRGLAKVKHAGKWKEGTLIYKKVNGHWVAKK